MHVQIVNFNLQEMPEAEYQAVCAGLAPVLADVHGLIAKVWLASAETNTYGGVYLWQDRAAMEAFCRSELFAGVLANPHLTNLASRDYAVLEEHTRVTRGLVAVGA